MSGSREPVVPERIDDRYRVLDVLGAGGSGTVVAAIDEESGQRVAIKLLLPELASIPESRAAFELEAATVGQLGLENVLPILDTGEVGGTPYHVMPFMPIGGLDALMASGDLTTRRLLSLLQRLATAIDALHSQGIVHRDLKPANILLSDDRPSEPWIADFGISQRVGQQSWHRVGTPAYAPPEQLRGAIPTPAADIYSLAAIVYHCVAGQPPFPRGTQAETELAQLLEPPPALAGPIGTTINDVMQAGLSKDPSARPRTASALVRALEERLSTLSSSLLDEPLPVRVAAGDQHRTE